MKERTTTKARFIFLVAKSRFSNCFSLNLQSEKRLWLMLGIKGRLRFSFRSFKNTFPLCVILKNVKPKKKMENIFENKEQILALIQRADNENETKRLTKKFQKLKKERKDFFLTLEELEEIFKWKLRSQYGRQTKHRSLNTNENIISITRTAFGITHLDEEYEIKLKLKLLTSISGVEIPVASAILTLCYPENYSVIDFRNWNQIYKTEQRKTNYTAKEYTDYLKIIRNLAKYFKLTPQEIDIAIWQKDREKKIAIKWKIR